MMSIDNPSTDPLELKYFSTTRDPTNCRRRRVEFVVENNGWQEVRAFTVSYRSTWLSNQGGGGGSVFVNDHSAGVLPVGSSKKVSIECDADEVLTLWVASCDFEDGSYWNNPRQSH
jgi:hypothetical protein